MPRVNDALTLERRDRVLTLWTRGYTQRGIARELGVDWQTVKHDITLLAGRAQKELDPGKELLRLLRGAQAVEVAAWGAQSLRLVLGAQKQQAAVLGVLAGLEVSERLAAVEQQLAALAGGQIVAQAPQSPALATNGRHGPG